MTREEGLRQIDEARWMSGDACLELRVNDGKDRTIHAWLEMRPHYCDRGHLKLLIEGPLNIDFADGFPGIFSRSRKPTRTRACF